MIDLSPIEKTPGLRLRALRTRLNLTLRDVAAATRMIAVEQDNDEFIVSTGLLSQVENKGLLPNVYRLYALAVVYEVALAEILHICGIPFVTEGLSTSTQIGFQEGTIGRIR